MGSLKTHLYPNFIIPVLLTFITFLTYVNILPNQLFFDDEELIYKNEYIKDFKYLPNYFTQNMIAGAGKVSNMYRPVLLISFAIDRHIWGNNHIGYHLTSIILHLLNSILVFIFIKNLFNNKILAFLTAILFIVHPIQSEAVSYASGRTDPLYTFFSLNSLNFFIYFLKTQKKYLVKTLKYLISLFFFILALLSKETAIILPLLLPLIWFIYTENKKNHLLKFVTIFLPFLSISLFYIYLRLTILNFANTLNFYTTQNFYSQNIFIRLLTFTGAFFQYLSTIFFPKDLMIARITPIITSLTNQWVIFFIILIPLIIIYSIKNWPKEKIYFFSLLWFFISILPVSGIIPINNTVSEHYLYLPSLSFFLIFSYLYLKSIKSSLSLENRTIKIVLFIFLITLFSLRTIIRTFDWRDPVTFYTKSLKPSPWHIPMRHNLAMTYAERDEYNLAINEYKKIIAFADIYPNTRHNLGNLYVTLGRYKEAEEEYKKALQLDPNFYSSYYALADLYQKTGEKEKLQEITDKISRIERK